jgi:hypothetical protein
MTCSSSDLSLAQERLVLAARRLRLAHHTRDARSAGTATAALIAAGGDAARLIDYLAGDLPGAITG